MWLPWGRIPYHPPEELVPLGQCLQPGHTLAPMAVQGGEHSPCLQAPDVYQPILGPVQISARAGSEGSQCSYNLGGSAPQTTLLGRGALDNSADEQSEVTALSS